MGLMIVIGIVGGIVAYFVALASRRPIIVAVVIGVLPSMALAKLPPFIGLPLLLSWLPCVLVGCLAAWLYRKVGPSPS